MYPSSHDFTFVTLTLHTYTYSYFFFFSQDYTLDVVHFGVTLLWVIANSVWGFVSFLFPLFLFLCCLYSMGCGCERLITFRQAHYVYI